MLIGKLYHPCSTTFSTLPSAISKRLKQRPTLILAVSRHLNKAPYPNDICYTILRTFPNGWEANK
jgi:hypothetical protein